MSEKSSNQPPESHSKKVKGGTSPSESEQPDAVRFTPSELAHLATVLCQKESGLKPQAFFSEAHCILKDAANWLKGIYHSKLTEHDIDRAIGLKRYTIDEVSRERNQSKDHISQCDFNMVGTFFGWVWGGALVSLLTAAVTSSGAAEYNGPKTCIPKIANIAGIQVGYSSMEELEGQLGKGKETTGGHPHGARLWRVKGTSWVIYADAFEYSERGAVVDRFDFAVDLKPGRGVPYARLAKNDIRWLGKISLGMDEDKLLETMKQNSCVPTKVADGWLVKAKGYSPLKSVPLHPFQQWTARFRIKEKSLIGMWLNAQERDKTK